MAQAIIGARVESMRLGAAAADAQLARLGIEVAQDSRIVATATDMRRAAHISVKFEEWFHREPWAAQLDTSSLSAEKLAANVVKARVERIAATESSQAFNRGLLEEARAVSEREGVVLYRRWDALLDACPICSDAHGDEVRVDEQYPNGEEPGAVHPYCRCTEEFLTEK